PPKKANHYSFLRQRLFVNRLDAFFADNAEHIAKARTEIPGSKTENCEVAGVAQVGPGHVQLTPAGVHRYDNVLGKIDLRHIPLNLPGFPDGLQSLGAGDAFGLDGLLVLDRATPFLGDLHFFRLRRSTRCDDGISEARKHRANEQTKHCTLLNYS